MVKNASEMPITLDRRREGINPLEVFHISLRSTNRQEMGPKGRKHLGNLPRELGAMRLPLKRHPLTNIYVTERYKLKVTPFRGYDSNALFYINGRRRTFNERIVPDENGFIVHEREKNKV